VREQQQQQGQSSAGKASKKAKECKLVASAFDQLEATLSSLASQRTPPHAIYVTVAHHPAEEAAVTKRLASITPVFKRVPVLVHRSGVAGPMAVLREVFRREVDGSTLLFVGRPGFVYPPLHVMRLAWSMEHHRVHGLEPAAYGSCGWTMLARPDPVGVMPVYTVHSGRQVDVLQHACGVMYRREFFDAHALRLMDVEAMEHAASHCWSHSELWLTGTMLASHHSHASSIAQVVLAPTDPHATLQLSGGDLTATSASASAGGAASDAASKLVCIRAIEAVVGDWRGTRRAQVREQTEPLF
jgi:hypothetical protein